MVTRLKELIPCEFDILNLESATAARYRLSSRTLYGRIRRYDATVIALTARDGAASPALALPSERLPVSRHFIRRTPAGYLVDGPCDASLAGAIDAHARAWHLLPLGSACSETDVDSALESLASTLISTI
jgi:hypothetical protein